MDVSGLNEEFNIEGADEITDDLQLELCRTDKERQSDWYQENRDRLLKKQSDYYEEKRDEINRKRRERRATEPYRTEYLKRQNDARKRRKNKSGSV